MKTFTSDKENKATRETKPEEKRKQEEEKRIEGLVFDMAIKSLAGLCGTKTGTCAMPRFMGLKVLYGLLDYNNRKGQDVTLAYICAPYIGQSEEETRENIERACEYGRYATKLGALPIILQLVWPPEYYGQLPKLRQRLSLGLLENCTEMWLFPGEEIPDEMWPEIILAAKKHIPIRVFEDGAMEE